MAEEAEYPGGVRIKILFGMNSYTKDVSEWSSKNRFHGSFQGDDATENKEEDGKVIRWPFVVRTVK